MSALFLGIPGSEEIIINKSGLGQLKSWYANLDVNMIALIVARSKNNVIGKDGHIPWQIPGEQSQFRELTTGNIVIMGRKTYEEIGRPLPNRQTIVISKSKKFLGPDLSTAGSVKEALEVISSKLDAANKNIYIAGGYGVYKEALPLVDAMYITEVDLIIPDGQTFFPDFNPSDFNLEIGQCLGNDIKYTRTLYIRKEKSAALLNL